MSWISSEKNLMPACHVNPNLAAERSNRAGAPKFRKGLAGEKIEDRSVFLP